MNRGAEVLLGWSREEMIGQHVRKVATPASVALAEDRIRRFLAGEKLPPTFEADLIRKDGGLVPVEAWTRVIRDPRGKLSGFHGIYRDITERKRAEEQFHRYQLLLQRYQTIFALSPDFIYLTDTTGKILDANPALLERTGLSLEHIQQMHFMDFFVGNTPEKLLQHFTSLQEGHAVRELEVRAKNVRGETFTYEVNATPLKENGEVTAILSLARDITARKRAEEQLKEEAEIAAALARVGQEMIASLNTPEILERLCRLTAEVLGCDCSHTILWRPEDNTYVAAAGYGDTPEQWETMQVLEVPAEMVVSLETRLTLEGMVEVEVTASQESAFESLLRQFGITAELHVALKHRQQFIGTQSAGYRGRRGFSLRQKRIARGIAQIASLALANARLLEELERSNQLKEDFVGAMSHELRTPINILLGYNEMLRDEAHGSLTPEQANILERMDKNARELLDLVNATLDLSRLQSQRVPLARQDVWVPTLLAELEAETRQLNRKPALRLEWQIAPDLPMLHTDVVKLKMTLKNIILNALKFTEEGTVTIAASPQDEGVTFVVTDTGPGIPPEVLPSIFEPFRQGESFATRRQGGVGLGLYIVQQLLTLLGGTVSVESEVGRGSTFRVWIPKETRLGGQS